MVVVKVKGPYLVMAFVLAESQGYAGHRKAEAEHVHVYASSDRFTSYKVTKIQSWGSILMTSPNPHHLPRPYF